MSEWIATFGDTQNPTEPVSWVWVWRDLLLDLKTRWQMAQGEGRTEEASELHDALVDAIDTLSGEPFTVTAAGVTFTIERAA